MNAPARPQGLTLIEVVLAVSIAGVLAAALLSGLSRARPAVEHASLAAVAARLDQAAARAAAEGRPLSSDDDIHAALARLRDPGTEESARHGGWTGAALDSSWSPERVGPDAPGERITWDGVRFRVATTGEGVRPFGTGADTATPPVDPEGPPEGAGFALRDPWVWDHDDAAGPDRDAVASPAAPGLRIEVDGVPAGSRILVDSTAPRRLRLVADPPGNLMLGVDGRSAEATGSTVDLVVGFPAGSNRDLWVVASRSDAVASLDRRLSVPLLARVPLAGSLELRPDPAGIGVEESSTTLARVPWTALWSNGASEQGTLVVPVAWSPPGGHEESLPLRHVHRGLVAEATLRVRHAERTWPVAFVATIETGSLPITLLRWSLSPESGGPARTVAEERPSPAPRGALTSHRLDARLPAGRWTLALETEDAAGPRPVQTLAVLVDG